MRLKNVTRALDQRTTYSKFIEIRLSDDIASERVYVARNIHRRKRPCLRIHLVLIYDTSRKSIQFGWLSSLFFGHGSNLYIETSPLANVPQPF